MLRTFGFVDDIMFAYNWLGKGVVNSAYISDSLGAEPG